MRVWKDLETWEKILVVIIKLFDTLAWLGGALFALMIILTWINGSFVLDINTK